MRALFILPLIFLAQCTHPGGTKWNPENGILLGVNVHRQLELEPCGCSISPKGGVEREWNALQKFEMEKKARVLSLSAGTTFAPVVEQYSKKRVAHYQIKAAAMVAALNALKVSAISPTIEDTVVGTAHLKKLEKGSNFPWVSANLVYKKDKQPVFRSHALLEWQGQRILIVGLSSQTHEKYSVSAEVEVVDPAKALEQVLRDVPQRDMVILLSSLTRLERMKIQPYYSHVQFILGGAKNEFTTRAEPLASGVLYINPSGRGQTVAIVTVSRVGSSLAFYNEGEAKLIQENQLIYDQQIKTLEKSLSEQSLTGDQTNTIQAEIGQYKMMKDQLDVMAREGSGTTSYYEAFLEDLDSRFDDENAENPLRQILAEWKKNVRSIALKEGH